ncbi:tripartite tricarboxylate transporter substrate binding protein [Siccirubricoccus sp. G192]|uniref:Bug family tripartite tricarboxylate transporter substrate binding protein n=1 Tax=Siccirubricoccus sp. G192 TaxID=2849651 RepID=UPI001C2BFC3F|nr:tripartite tricarboxylate transporter substrate binding protein [Siccirubricoccus sp. G192]MBV1795582.1 tripartite tricarboxylate transporter substrate binding protein [Siccirubricoccus sp. G192]
MLAAPGLLHAQGSAWPNRPVRLVVPFPPAGTTDITGRIAAEMISPRLGQQMVVENRSGATGNLGAEHVARSDPDGYTLLCCTISTAAINYSLWGARMQVKPEDLAAVALLIRVPNVIFVPAESPIRTAQELVAAAKARPGALNYGSAGSGGSPHMCMEMFMMRTGTSLVHVPFRGAGPMLIEAVAGRLDAGCDNMPSCLGHIRDGRLRALAVTSAGRSPALPDVPTLVEAGVPDFEATAWFGVQAPSRTPRPIIERLGTELDAITRTPAYRARITELGGDPPGLTPEGGTTPAAFEAFIKAEIARWAEVVQVSGAKVD